MRISEEEIKNARQAIAKFVFNTKNISGRFIVFLAIAGMIIDAWDFSSISLVNFSFVNTFHPSAFILGLSAGTINIGAAIGAILGGYFTDRFGRRYMFIINMILFVIMAALSALATDVTEYILFRTILGFALGADVATGFSYLFEFLENKQRINYISSWAIIWGIMFLTSISVASILHIVLGSSNLMWRIVLGLGSLFSLIILLFRTRIPESALWLAHRGNFKSAKEIIKRIYGVELTEVPDVDLNVKTSLSGREIIKVFKMGYTNYLIHGWTQSFLVAFVFWGFGFYVPLIINNLNPGGSFLGNMAVNSYIYGMALIGGVIAPFIVRKTGLKNLVTSTTMILALLFLLIYLESVNELPISLFSFLAGLVMFFLFLGPMGFFSLVNPAIPSSQRGIVNGWTYLVNKVTAAFASLFGASIFGFLGLGGESLLIMIIALVIGVISQVVGREPTKINPVEVENKAV